MGAEIIKLYLVYHYYLKCEILVNNRCECYSLCMSSFVGFSFCSYTKLSENFWNELLVQPQFVHIFSQMFLFRLFL